MDKRFTLFFYLVFNIIHNKFNILCLYTDKNPPAIVIVLSKDKKQSLVMKHMPPLENLDPSFTNNGIYLSPKCLSIEKIFATAVRSFAISQLRGILTKLSVDLYFKDNTELDEELPCLKFQPFHGCTTNELVSISIDSRSGLMILNVGIKTISKFLIHQTFFCWMDYLYQYFEFIIFRFFIFAEASQIQQLQGYLRQDLTKFMDEFHELRWWKLCFCISWDVEDIHFENFLWTRTSFAFLNVTWTFVFFTWMEWNWKRSLIFLNFYFPHG